ncbi:hypothetical protein KAI87_09350, partial [Myxococcota bacterium]|nr:hypothetical protein [Myxococcota bacterium]
MPTGSELITTSASITKALSGTPASLKAIRKSLEKKAWLIQSFNMGQDPTLIALITPTTFSLIQNTTNSIQKILTQIQALKKDIALPEHIYFDFSDRAILETSSLTLDDKKVITLSEVLSATWLVASFKNRNLATANPLQLGGKQVDNEMMFVPAHMASRSSLERFGKGRSLIFMDLPSTSYQSAALPPGHAYLHFSTGGSPQESEQIDLHTLSKLRLNTQVMITVTKKSDPRIKRALARNLLISGIPSLIEIERAPTQNLNQFVSTFSSALPQEGAAGALILAQKENPKIKARLLGYRGMSRTESVNFALNEILRLAKAGGRTFKAARSKQDMSLWDAARVHFEDLLTMIEFLLEPESTVLLKSSKNKLARALRSRLKKLNIDNQGNLAQIHLA